MRIHGCFVVTMIVVATLSNTVQLVSSARQRSPDFDDVRDANDYDDSKCGLYLATSSTSDPDDEQTKWGVYAGKDIESDSPIGYGDVAIHTFHFMANNIWMDTETEEIMDDLDKNELANIVDWFEQFVWVPNSSGGYVLRLRLNLLQTVYLVRSSRSLLFLFS